MPHIKSSGKISYKKSSSSAENPRTAMRQDTRTKSLRLSRILPNTKLKQTLRSQWKSDAWPGCYRMKSNCISKDIAVNDRCDPSILIRSSYALDIDISVWYLWDSYRCNWQWRHTYRPTLSQANYYNSLTSSVH